MTKQELDGAAKVAASDLASVNKAFQALRADGSAEDLVKAANAVTKAVRLAEKSQHEADTFELVAVYEGIRADMYAIVERMDTKMLLKHEIKSVTITVPVQTEPFEPEKLIVNTLGKRTVLKAGGNGSRARYVYGPEKLNSRQLVEQYGPEELGDEKTQATLDEPSKHGLTHIADRIAKKLEFDKVPA